MKFGLSVQNFGSYGDPNVLIDLARDAESAGWDGFFVWDHLFLRSVSDQPFVDPMIALAGIAARTERIRLGPMVTIPARRRPWKLAREAVTLDHLSRGRLVLGIGLGWSRKDDFDSFGEEGDPRVRAEKLDESLEILAGLWSGEAFSYQGRHYTVQDVRFTPRPLQQPRIPVWIAGNLPGNRPFRRAARWDGAFPQKIPTGPDDWQLTPDEVMGVRDLVRRHRPGGEPFDIAIAGPPLFDFGDEAHETVRLYEAAGATWWMVGVLDEIGPLEDMREMVRAGPWGKPV